MKLILRVIVLREKTIAFDETECGYLKNEWGLPYLIPVVEHKPWQNRAFLTLFLGGSILKYKLIPSL